MNASDTPYAQLMNDLRGGGNVVTWHKYMPVSETERTAVRKL